MALGLGNPYLVNIYIYIIYTWIQSIQISLGECKGEVRILSRGGGGEKEKLGLRREISGKREKTYVKELKGSKRGTLLSY